MPSITLLEMPPEEQTQMRAVLRRARYGSLLAFQVFLLGAAGRNPTEIAAFLFCLRSSGDRLVRAYRTGSPVYVSTKTGGARWLCGRPS